METKPDKMPLIFKGLSDKTRLRILNLLVDGELCVCELGGVLKLAQPKISRHLAYLKKAGLVQSRREGKWIYYQWVTKFSPAVGSVLDGLRLYMAQDSGMCRERAKIENRECE